MKKILTILFVMIGFISKAQYNPSLHVTVNDAMGMAQATPTDSRSQFYNSTTFTYRNYANRAEVLSYLNLAKYRSGRFPIYMDTSGHTGIFWFQDCTLDTCLKFIQTVGGSTDSSIFATNYRVDTAKLNLRALIAGKLQNTLATGKIWAGDLSGNAAQVTPGGDLTMTSGGSFTIGNNTITFPKLQTLPSHSVFGRPDLTSGNSRALYLGYGTIFDNDTVKVDTTTLKPVFAGSSGATFENGLTESGGVVKLGGLLTGNTTIDGDGLWNLRIPATAELTMESYDTTQLKGAATIIESSNAAPNSVSVKTGASVVRIKVDNNGAITYPTLASATDTSAYKPGAYNPTTKEFKYFTYWPGGGGGAGTLTKVSDSVRLNGVFSFRDSVQWGVVTKPVVKGTASNIRNDASSMVVLPDGTWLIAYTAYGTSGGDVSSAIIATRRSTDKGVTWSAVDTAVFNVANGVYIPSLYLQKNGTVIMLYDHQPTINTSQIKKVTLSAPYTPGTWSAPSLVYGSGTDYYAPAGDRITQLSSGTLLYPFSVCTSPSDCSSAVGTYVGKLLASYDDGSTWNIVSTFTNTSPDGLCNEPGVFQMNDKTNTIFYYYRTRSGDVFCTQASSSDTTFDGNQSYMNLMASNSTSTIKWFTPQQIAIAIFNPHDPNGSSTRNIMQLASSSDGFTWTNKLRVDSLTSYLFIEPALCFTPDNEMVISYSRYPSVTNDTTNLYTQRIPAYYIQNGAPTGNVFNNIVIRKGNVDYNKHLFEAYLDGIPDASAYFFLDNQTLARTFFSPWWRNKSSQQPILWDNNVPSSRDAFVENAWWGTSTSVGDAYYLHAFKNNGTEKMALFGNGELRLPFYGNGSGDQALGVDLNGKVKIISGGGISGSGTSGKIPVFTGSTSIGNSTASDDGTFFTIPKANIGTGSAISGWEMKVEGNLNTNILFQNNENNNNYNIFRAEKTKAGSHTIGQIPVFDFDAQGGVAKYTMVGNNEVGSDGYTNVDHKWSGRQDVSLNEIMRLTNEGTLITKKWEDVSALLASFTWASLSNAYFNISNVTTAGAFAPWIRTRSNNSGYGILWDINSTANNGGFVVDVNNNGANINNANMIFDWQNHGTSKLTLLGNGNLGIGNSSPAVSLVTSFTDAWGLPSGTTAQRPTGVAAYMRYNSDSLRFEGYNGANWKGIAWTSDAGSGGSDTLKLVTVGTPGVKMLWASNDSLKSAYVSNGTLGADSTLTINTLYTADGTLAADRTVTGNSKLLQFGTSGSRLTSLSVFSGGFQLQGNGTSTATIDPGASSSLVLGNSGSNTEIKGNLNLNSVLTGTDADISTTALNKSVIILPDITANRTLQLSTLKTGNVVVVMNRNTTGNTWSTTGFTLKDAAGSTITNLVNSTVYIVVYDGTNYIKVN